VSKHFCNSANTERAALMYLVIYRIRLRLETGNALRLRASDRSSGLRHKGSSAIIGRISTAAMAIYSIGATFLGIAKRLLVLELVHSKKCGTNRTPGPKAFVRLSTCVAIRHASSGRLN
jgi:hypothetical protein